MSCIVTLHAVGNKHCRPLVRGNEPVRPANWSAKAWFVLPNGEKHTHSAEVKGETVRGLIPYMGALIDSLVADHGNEVASCGWTASTHGGKR